MAMPGPNVRGMSTPFVDPSLKLRGALMKVPGITIDLSFTEQGACQLMLPMKERPRARGIVAAGQRKLAIAYGA
jgi:hypothetical protein